MVGQKLSETDAKKRRRQRRGGGGEASGGGSSSGRSVLIVQHDVTPRSARVQLTASPFASQRQAEAAESGKL